MIARVPVGAQDDERELRAVSPEEIEAIAGLAQADVAEDDIGRLAVDQLARRRDVAGGPDHGHARRPLEQRGEAVRDGRVVLHDGDPDHLCPRISALPPRVRRSSGSRTVTIVPSPTFDDASIVPPWAVTISRAT